MEKLSYILTCYLVKKNVVAAEKSSIYQYGFQIGMEVCLNTIISVLIAFFCHMVWETIIFFVVFMLLRSYAGGLHLRTYICCLICSCMSLFTLLMFVKYWNIDSTIALAMVFMALLVIKLLSPVQDINRPISHDEMKKFRKRLNYSIVIILILSVIFYVSQLKKMLVMISVTSLFMIVILILGKINYAKSIKESQKNQSVG